MIPSIDYLSGNYRLWTLGQLIRCHGKNIIPATAFMFLYSGFGLGNLLMPDGNVVWCNKDEACHLCEGRGAEMTTIYPL